MDESTIFMNNLKGGTAANLLTGFFFLLFWFLKNKCKHLECKSHTRFCSCNVREDSYESKEDIETGQRREQREDVPRQKTFKFPGPSQINVRELQAREHLGILSERQKAIPTD